VQFLQQRKCPLGLRTGPLDAQLGAPAREPHAQRLLDAAQVLVQRTAQVGQAAVVVRLELMAQDQGRGPRGGWAGN
jgi:hypothetical protein